MELTVNVDMDVDAVINVKEKDNEISNGNLEILNKLLKTSEKLVKRLERVDALTPSGVKK